MKNWQHILKRYYDREQDIKFIISGSSSLFIQKRTTESLAGRIIEIAVPPLRFWEYLTLTGGSDGLARRLAALNLDFEKPESSLFASEIEEIRSEGLHLEAHFDEYVCRGQFPEPAGWSEEDAYEYIKNSVSLVSQR